ncbi:MAG: transporter substrate-binding domain-containing protein [Verrucomicrobiota bacterium]
MKLSRFLIGVFGLGVVFFGLGACETTPTVDPAPNLMRVGITPNAPPMAYKAGGEITGLEAELARTLAQELGKEVAFVPTAWENLIPGLQANQFDIVMSGMAITRDREMLVSFGDPYLEVGLTLLVRDKDMWTYEYPKVILITPVKVGVEAGTSSDVFIQRNGLKATRVPFDSPEAAVAALKSGSIDVFLSDAPIIWRLAAEHATEGVAAVPRMLTSKYLAWAYPQGGGQLRQEANAVLAKWKASGTLNAIVGRWIPMR